MLSWWMKIVLVLPGAFAFWSVGWWFHFVAPTQEFKIQLKFVFVESAREWKSKESHQKSVEFVVREFSLRRNFSSRVALEKSARFRYREHPLRTALGCAIEQDNLMKRPSFKFFEKSSVDLRAIEAEIVLSNHGRIKESDLLVPPSNNSNKLMK